LDDFKNQKSKLIYKNSTLKILKINIRSMLSLIYKLKRPKAFVRNIYMLIYQFRSEKTLSKKIDYLYSYQAIDFLLDSKKSFIRLGDSEIHHMLSRYIVRKDEGFQIKTPELTSRLRKIIQDYNANSNYILGFNLTFLKMTDFELFRTGLYSLHYQQRYFFKKYIRKFNNVKILDAMIFRPVSDLTNEKISELYKNKDVILVHNDNKLFLNFRLIHQTGKTYFVQIKEKNAFDDCDITISKILELTNGYKYNEVVVMISGGPAAKVMVYELSKSNVHAIDMGHYFKWKFSNNNNDGAL